MKNIHIEERHTLDVIMFQLLLVFQWFNPFVWLYKPDNKITHEYLADIGTLNSGIELQEYHYALLNQTLRANNFEITSSFNLSVKKRIAHDDEKKILQMVGFKAHSGFARTTSFIQRFCCKL